MNGGIGSIQQLEDRLSEPMAGVVQAMRDLEGDIVILGAGGKMGPSLSRMARRASYAAGIKRRVIAISRFSSATVAAGLTESGVETVSCDLMDQDAVARLPDAPNVVYMAGMKFGTTGNEPMTWALNAFLPGIVCRKYRASRVIAFSSGNVYGVVPVTSKGSRETDAPRPSGEYAWSVLGRERVFQYFSTAAGTPVVLIRLNYACEMRYGVLVDIAQRVRDGRPVNLAMGWLNTIWEGDANAVVLQAFSQAAVPARILNLTGPETLRVREVAEKLGRIMGRPVIFEGEEEDSALLSDADAAHDLFGLPTVRADTLIQWVADWVARGGATFGKPTHFESRDGRF